MGGFPDLSEVAFEERNPTSENPGFVGFHLRAGRYANGVGAASRREAVP
ncbi:MAG: hypothetical protein RMY34_11130 [Aulosira sp. DedQUE10]|nr:hypothetical protein [Aulosira sp. DedQUE10]